MRKMDFMRYTSIQIVTLCADLYKKQKLKGFIITTEYTNVVCAKIKMQRRGSKSA